MGDLSSDVSLMPSIRYASDMLHIKGIERDVV